MSIKAKRSTLKLSINGEHSNQNQIWQVKIGESVGGGLSIERSLMAAHGLP